MDDSYRAILRDASDGIGQPADYCVYSLVCGTERAGAADNFEERPRWYEPAREADLRFYVGFTSDIYRRMEQHFSGDGAEFTQIFPPSGIRHLAWVDTQRQGMALERKLAAGLRTEYQVRRAEAAWRAEGEFVPTVYVYQY